MSSRLNGYGSGPEHRPSSEQMADLHVYIVPPDIWREKFNNALNSNINDTVSLGFIRVHPETKIYALRDEIEQQLGADLVPREYVFLKSVGRSLTRLRSRQEATLKVKNFLPPQAYAPEVYLLEATPEVRQAIAASSENSTRPQTRTSYDYEYISKSDDNAKTRNMPNGAGYPSYFPTLPEITPRNPADSDTSIEPRSETSQSSSRHPPYSRQSSARRRHSPPTVTKTSATPRAPLSPRDPRHSTVNQNEHINNNTYNQNKLSVDWEEEPISTNLNPDTKHTINNHQTPTNSSNTQPTNSSINRPPKDLRIRAPLSSDPNLDHPQHQLVSSPRRNDKAAAHDEYLPPLSATPPNSANGKQHKSRNHGNTHGNHGHLAGQQHKHEEDSGIAGFTPDTYRESDNNVLDRRKGENDENDRLRGGSPTGRDSNDPEGRGYEQDQEESERDRQRQEEQDRQRREEEERRRQEEEEQRRKDEEREQMQNEAKLIKTNSEEDLTRYPSPPPLRLASPERDTASARARRRKQKEELMKELEEAREARKTTERQREELVKTAKLMQNKTQNRRNHARDLWKKRYFEEKKKTVPLEEQCNRLRHELDIIHKRLLTTLEGPKEKATKLNDLKGSTKVGATPRPLNNFKIQATRLQHEIEDIRRRVDHAKMKLTSEMKLRNQAETELRALRAELTQKKINLTLSRNSHLTAYAPPAADVNFMTARSAITPRS